MLFVLEGRLHDSKTGVINMLCGQEVTIWMEKGELVTPEERIIALEREIQDTRLAAARIILGMCEGISRTPKSREDLAIGFERAAHQATDAAEARISRLVSAALRGT